MTVAQIADDAMQAAYKTIADELESCGYPVTGDVSPGEMQQLQVAFRAMVRSMALNNDAIGAMQP